MSSPGPMLMSLPAELLRDVFSRLPNRDIKNVRLTCSRFRDHANLHLERVFLSPNPLNIRVFKAIAKDDGFRQKVIEIIYDDARLPEHVDGRDNANYEEIQGRLPKEVPRWYMRGYHNSFERLTNYRDYDTERPDHIEVAKQFEARFDIKKSYEYYKTLLKQQDKVVKTNSDIKAFEYGLKRFPHLQRITLTPAAHGDPFFPFYPTPMIRRLPYGFIYPLPRGWPMKDEKYSDRPAVRAWTDDETKDQWRGFRLLTRAIARYFREDQNNMNKISEFIVDAAQLTTGLSCRIFDDPENNEEYSDLTTIFEQPGFSRIDLALTVLGQCTENWHALRSGHLHTALSRASSLHHFSLSTNVDRDQNEEEKFIPLRTIFPVEIWTQLRHFGLSRFFVKQSDLVAFLGALPSTLRSIELSFLFFHPSGGNYRDLLFELHRSLAWHTRPVAETPKVTMHIFPPHSETLVIDISREITDFFYHGGPNPFAFEGENEPGTYVDETGIQRNIFNPALDRPNVSFEELMELGIIEC